MTPVAVLFDFDLTLADSSRGAIECVGYALDRLQMAPAADRRILETIGLSLPETFARLTGVTEPDLAAEFARHFVARADQVMVDMTTLYPCVPGVLAKLGSAGLALGIVSTKFRHRIEAVLSRARLRDAFRVIVGAEDVPAHKPDPSALLLAARGTGHRPEEIVYVGDHPVDAEAACRAGMPFVAVLTGFSPPRAFLSYPRMASIDDLSDLPRLLGVSEIEA